MTNTKRAGCKFSEKSNKYTYVHLMGMAHKTLTISEEAYDALARLKTQNESFTEVILRLAKKRASRNLLEYVRSMPPDEELADLLEGVLDEREQVKLSGKGR